MMKALLLSALLALASTPVRATTFLVEAEGLQMPGSWLVNSGSKGEVKKYLLASGDTARAPAVGAIDLPHAGKWRLWVRSKDFPKDRPGIRKFSVRLGEACSATLFGRHGKAEFDGWAWEDGGVFELPGGATLVALGEEVTPSARCDALVLTDNLGYRPEGPPGLLQKQLATTVPLVISEESRRAVLPDPLVEIEAAPEATLENETMRLTFHLAKTAAGTAVAMQGEARDGAGWKKAWDDPAVEAYHVLFRPSASDPKINSARVYPTWDAGFSPEVEVSAGGVTVRTRLGTATTPWTAGRCFPLRPIGVRQADALTVELTFAPTPEGTLTAVWRLLAGMPGAQAMLRFQPSEQGYYSLGYHAPVEMAPTEADFLLLPFMLHGRRFPEEPSVMLSATMPTPMALVNRGGVSCALTAAPEAIPFAWPTSNNSRYAVGLRNEAGRAQPILYSPVLGMPGSVSRGEPVEAAFRLCVQSGDWYAAYRRVADELFQLKDYRQPTTASLSEAALNLLDFIRDEAASGWDRRAKGPWNIESRNTVTQAAPLTYLSLYLLTGDRGLYERFARPSLEYMLSRPGPHFAAEREISDNYYHHQPMRGPAAFYGAHWFAAADAMTQGRSPVFGQYCLDAAGGARVSTSNGHAQPFEEALSLFELTRDERWRKEATAGADKYIDENLTKLPAKDLGDRPFVNVSFVPDWEGLLHLYEATGEQRYLDGAREGSRWLMTTLWTQPSIPDDDFVIHPGGVYDAQRHLWWWGDRIHRLGIYDGPAADDPPYPPPTPLPEERAPAWQVSQVGLGLEQPCTYTRKGPQANILMSTWAPNLLRLAPATGDAAYRTAARNAIIGRFANYPGYYLDGFTTVYQRPDYPMTGPDVTSLYVHHAPAFLAAALDYLFTEAEMRTGGAVKFPWVRQYGYVWFDNRLFGQAPGAVYGEAAWPWLHRTAVTVDNLKIDRVLAEGGGKLHAVLMNESRAAQKTRVHFSEAALGRSLEGAQVSVRIDQQPPVARPIESRSIELELAPLGSAVLTLDQVKIDVPTHRVIPPERIALPTSPAVSRKAFPGTPLEAVGMVLQAPPFTWRDFYVYITAGLDDLESATLYYRVGDGPERRVEAERFPWEFSVKIDEMSGPVIWTIDATLAKGRSVHAGGENR